MSHDITHILQNWEFDPGKTYRKIVGDDGREKIQVRVDNAAFQGVLQMELDGRPDGKQPYGYDFAFDYYRLSLKRYEKAHGTTKGFSLDPSACSELFDESLRIYNRYVFLLQLQDYPRVVRDTNRNMELFRFVNRYAEREKDRVNLEKWWPYILRINATARAMLAIQEKQDFENALRVVDNAAEKIANLPEISAEEFQVELERSQKALKEMAKAIKAHMPMTEMEKLQAKLNQAVAEERYEDAARIRDEIKGHREED
ncbi:MAG: UvrB/UvrC motif-containing protein [Deltaproteobacteria bacterium]|nr:UvrB/UvrC motif-containing protein [Deltaproteobacteria bacterium]